MRGRAGFLAAVAMLAAGCVDDGNNTTTESTSPAPRLAFATWSVSAPGFNATWSVEFDDASRPSTPAYGGTAFDRPDNFTVHDLLVVWANQTGETYRLADIDEEYGYLMESMLGFAATGNETQGWFWAMYANGALARKGLSSQPVATADHVLWVYEEWHI